MKRHLSSQETLLQQTNHPGITIIYQRTRCFKYIFGQNLYN